MKRLSLFLAGETLQPKRAIANIVDREVIHSDLTLPYFKSTNMQVLHMFFVHDDLIVQYFIPATSLV